MRRVLVALFLILASGLDGRAVVAADTGLPQPISATPLPPPSVISLSRHHNGELFFDVYDTAPPSTDRTARPRRVRVYWDQSISRADDNVVVERDLLRRYLDAVHPGIIDLVLLSAIGPELRIVEAPQEAEQVAAVLQNVRYEEDAAVHEILDLELPPADACVYVSNGAASIDPADAERIRCPLFVISSAEDANRGLLRVLARRGAGGYFDLAETSVDDAVAAMTGALPRILGVASPDGREIDYALVRSGPDRFRIIGPVPKSGEIVVTLASGAKRTRAYSTKRVQVRTGDSAGMLWAVDRLHELCASKQPDSKRIAALAQRYSLSQ